MRMRGGVGCFVEIGQPRLISEHWSKCWISICSSQMNNQTIKTFPLLSWLLQSNPDVLDQLGAFFQGEREHLLQNLLFARDLQNPLEARGGSFEKLLLGRCLLD